MAGRCAPTVPMLLPFLYPSTLFRIPQRASRKLAAASRLQIRHHITENGPGAEPEWSRLNPAPDDYAIQNFADKAKLTIFAGAGGHGCISFAREAYLPDGPPNGGNGGHGGNIYIQAAHGETSLHKLARRNHIRAGRGKHGRGSAQTGQKGDDVIITVPVGTVIREISREDPAAEEAQLERASRSREVVEIPAEDDDASNVSPPAEDPSRHKWMLYPGISSTDAKNMEYPRLPRRERFFAQPKAPIHLDLSRPTPRPILLAAGGLGGLGNPSFVAPVRPRPQFATKGEDAMSMKIELELKLLADVGLVGLPNAGKSTLLRAVSNSRARVGSWAFTTLQPNIGTVVLDNNKGRPLLRSINRHQVPDRYSYWAAGDTDVSPRTRFTIADIPGLIEGAHLDKGLGIEFLRHVERAGVLAFVIDLAAGNAVDALKALWNEVSLYAQMREEEEKDLERESRINWDENPDPFQTLMGSGQMLHADYPEAPGAISGLHIAGKPWFVVATKGDLPNTQENFEALRVYMTSISQGDAPHPSGIKGAWTENCAAIPISAIGGKGVDRVVHWAVGLMDL